MSIQGITDWGIDSLTLPICHGRYENSIAKVFNTIQSQKGKKFDYMYKWGFLFLGGGSWIFFRVTLKAFISIRMTLETIQNDYFDHVRHV